MPQHTHEVTRRAYLAPVLVVVLFIAGTAANLGYRAAHEPPDRRAIELREHEDLATLIAASGPTIRRYYTLHVELLDLAAGAELVMHPDAPLNAVELRGFARVTARVDEDHEPELGEEEVAGLRELPHRDGVLWLRGQRDDIPYRVVEPPDTPSTLLAMRAGDELVIVDERTLAEVRDALGGCARC